MKLLTHKIPSEMEVAQRWGAEGAEKAEGAHGTEGADGTILS